MSLTKHITLTFSILLSTMGVQGQWVDISDSLPLPCFMLNGYYSPGISAVDVDGDGAEDLTFGNDLHGIDLYLKHDSGFAAQSVELGMEPGDCTVRSVIWADMDNDGDQDLFLTCRVGQNRVFRNLGGLEMQDITDSCGIIVDPARRSFGASLADINRDGFLDLYVSNYPTVIPLYPNEFYLGDGQGHFTETEWGLPQDAFRASHQSHFVDLDGDHMLDLYVLNDRGTGNECYKGTDTGFVDVSAAWGLEAQLDAMGAGWVDEELDGKREVFITGTDEAMFLKDTGNLQYTDVAPEYGMPSEIVTGWSVLGVDFDNDGWEDIYTTSADWVMYAHPPPSFYTPEPNQWYWNDQGNGWVDRSDELPGLMEEIYVAAHADWNADGTPDIAAVPVGTHALLLEGEPNGHHWLEVLPKGTVSNRDAIGTKVTAFTTDSTGGVIQRVRQLACGEGMLAQYSRWLHFGLGNTTTIDSLEIRWPLGDVDMLYGVAADQRLVLTEGAIGPDCTDLATYDPAACGCPADFDANGIVGVEDIILLLSAYGCTSGNCVADLDADGITGTNDIVILLAAFGTPCLAD